MTAPQPSHIQSPSRSELAAGTVSQVVEHLFRSEAGRQEHILIHHIPFKFLALPAAHHKVKQPPLDMASFIFSVLPTI